MKNLKKAAALLFAAMLMMACAAGCGSKEAETSAPAENAPEAEKVYQVGICQFVQHEALDQATEGFKDALASVLGGRVEFDEQNASGDAPVCATIANQFVASNMDLILANATPALQACANATTTIPILGTSISDYGTALSLDMGATDPTGINVTGTCDLAPLSKQAEQLTALFPEAKQIGILYCSAEANSKFQADNMKALLEEKGLTVEDYTFTDSNDMQAVSTAAVENSEVIYVPTDNTVASNGSILDNIASAAKVPIVAGEENTCLAVGGVATLSINYYDLGYQTGEMAADILVNEVDPGTVNVQMAKQVTFKYLPQAAEAYGVNIPKNYIALEK